MMFQCWAKSSLGTTIGPFVVEVMRRDYEAARTEALEKFREYLRSDQTGWERDGRRWEEVANYVGESI